MRACVCASHVVPQVVWVHGVPPGAQLPQPDLHRGFPVRTGGLCHDAYWNQRRARPDRDDWYLEVRLFLGSLNSVSNGSHAKVALGIPGPRALPGEKGSALHDTTVTGVFFRLPQRCWKALCRCPCDSQRGRWGQLEGQCSQPSQVWMNGFHVLVIIIIREPELFQLDEKWHWKAKLEITLKHRHDSALLLLHQFYSFVSDAGMTNPTSPGLEFCERSNMPREPPSCRRNLTLCVSQSCSSTVTMPKGLFV